MVRPLHFFNKKGVVFLLIRYAIQDFKEDREFKQISKATLTNYMGCLQEFHKYCIEMEIVDITDVSSSTVKNYLIYCQKQRNNNPTTINSKLRSLKIFFNYLEEVEIFTSKNNPTKKTNYIRANVKIEVFSDVQIKEMLSYYRRLKSRDKSFYAYRDSTIIVNLLGTGMRLGELINLKWSDIDFQNRSIIVFGKLKTQTSIPMADKLHTELLEYHAYCKKEFEKIPVHVFVNRNGKQLTADAIKNIFKRLKEKMNFTNVRCSAYDFRHTFAHRFLTNGGDVFTLQKLLRHSSIAMTQRYLAIWGTALHERNEKFNPLNNIDI